MPFIRKNFTLGDDGLIRVPLEEIWTRVRRWARRNDKQYVATYGVVGVAPC